jgi:hypothetical protein
MRERPIQKKAVELLKQAGFKYVSTSARKRTENTPGTPDLFVNVYGTLWIGVELKADENDVKVSKEQRELNEEGRTLICDSPTDVLTAAIVMRERLIHSMRKKNTVQYEVVTPKLNDINIDLEGNRKKSK